MNARFASGWGQIHFDPVLVDLHARPSFHVSFFQRTLTTRLVPLQRGEGVAWRRSDTSYQHRVSPHGLRKAFGVEQR